MSILGRGPVLRTLALVALAALGTLPGCGSDSVKPAELSAIKPTAKVKVLWRASVGGAGAYAFSPAGSPERVYAAAERAEVSAFDRRSGKLLWRSDVKEPLSAGVAADGDLVLVGSEKGTVIALGTDGRERWRTTLSSEVLGSPRLAGSVVVVRSHDGRIFGLDAATGQRRWDYATTLPPLILRAFGSVSIAGEFALAGMAGGKLVALNVDTGALVWETTVAQPKGSNELERITDVAAAPLVEGAQACAASFQGRVACYDLTRGSLLWGRDASSAAALGADPGTLYMTDEKGTVWSFDKTSGATLWKQDKLAARQVSGPLVAGGFVVVGDYEGYIHVLNREDGSFAARLATDGSPILVKPVRLGGEVLVQTRAGGLYVLDIQ